jgi:PRTRC genetic system protein B
MITVKEGITGGGTITLSKCIMLYGAGNSAVATIHDVRVDEKTHRSEILPGRGISLRNLQDLVVTLTSDKRSCYLEERVLAASFVKLVWYTPPSRRPLWIKTKRKAFNRQMNGRDVTHPGLVFVAEPGQLRVFAVFPKNKRRPGPDTRLFVAPYYNIWDDNKVCLGNATYPKILLPSTIQMIEKGFFESTGTHSTRAGKLTYYPGGHDAYWMEMRSRARIKKVNPRWFVPTGLTLEKVINEAPTS